MLVLYLATAVVDLAGFRHGVRGLIDRVRFKGFDRQLGGIFGAVKGVLWCVVITFFAVTLSESRRQAVLKSRSGYYIAVFTHRATPMLAAGGSSGPGQVHRRVGSATWIRKQPAAPASRRRRAAGTAAGQKI